jgi:molybdopterin-guanine dinucleotide biosynthesis protein B
MITIEDFPDFSQACCNACGLTCTGLKEAILSGEATLEDCILSAMDVELLIDGKLIKLVPFVQRILKNAIIGVVSELDGYHENAKLEIRI